MKKFIKFLLMAIGWESYTSENEKMFLMLIKTLLVSLQTTN